MHWSRSDVEIQAVGGDRDGADYLEGRDTHQAEIPVGGQGRVGRKVRVELGTTAQECEEGKHYNVVSIQKK